MLRPLRRRDRLRKQKLVEVEVRGTAGLQQALAQGYGVLITPNHASHADAYSMYEVSDYVAERPSIERLAETLDKFEEDVLGKYAPTVRAARKVTAYLGEPVAVEAGRKRKEAARELTDRLEGRVQKMLDGHGEA